MADLLRSYPHIPVASAPNLEAFTFEVTFLTSGAIRRADLKIPQSTKKAHRLVRSSRWAQVQLNQDKTHATT